ncbi:MAG: 50S ribosomal protein L28 [Chitinivibrionales bacterium]|nr:50S ribosomal protein L28 [Chitinivibrionales bacterium]
MAKVCEVCGKTPQAGRRVSHAHNIVNRKFYPNLRTIKTVVNGTPTKKTICMRCLKTTTKAQ